MGVGVVELNALRAVHADYPLIRRIDVEAVGQKFTVCSGGDPGLPAGKSGFSNVQFHVHVLVKVHT
jgi:hypothetical protein